MKKINKKKIFRFFEKNKVVVAILFAIIIIILRRIDAISNPQFWAEDGVVWFSKAYNEGGFKSLIQPQNGYFQSISKLVAWASLLFPLKFAPLIFNFSAIIIKALPVGLMWSDRFSKIVPSIKFKLLLSLAYLLLPTIGEVHSNITNAHWHLALYAFMIIISNPANSILEKIHDIFFMIISSLSGPFSIILSPIVIIFWWFRKATVSFFFYCLAFVLLVSAVIQTVSFLLTSGATRSQAPLGASPELFIKLVSAKLFGVLLFGEKYVNDIAKSLWLALPIFVFGLSIIIFAMYKAKIELKLLIIFSALLVISALVSPMVSTTSSQWPLMKNSSTGARYFFIPLVTWATTLFWFLSQLENKRIKIMSIAIIGLLMINATITDFKLKKYKDKKFYMHAEIFHNLPSGAEYSIPINPGKGWDIKLVKK